MNALRTAALAGALAISACTPNGISAAGGGGGGGGGVTHTVAINLTNGVQVSTPYGQSLAYTPAVIMASVGDSIVFKNTDSFPHTASVIPVSQTSNETKFPSPYQFPISAETQTASPTMISNPAWTSGALQAGSSSQTIHADKAGTYLYGCFFHYGAGMRGAIVVK